MMTRFSIAGGLLLMAQVMSAAECSKCPVDHQARAGQPRCVHCWAIPSNTPRYCGGWIGGGAAFAGGDPYVKEGTWGWDYTGFVTKRVFLGWSHHKAQAGGGKYDTDRHSHR